MLHPIVFKIERLHNARKALKTDYRWRCCSTENYCLAIKAVHYVLQRAFSIFCNNTFPASQEGKGRR